MRDLRRPTGGPYPPPTGGRAEGRVSGWPGDIEASPEPVIHPDHDAEQAYLHHARTALDTMIERSTRAVDFSERAVREENTIGQNLHGPEPPYGP